MVLDSAIVHDHSPLLREFLHYKETVLAFVQKTALKMDWIVSSCSFRDRRLRTSSNPLPKHFRCLHFDVLPADVDSSSEDEAKNDDDDAAIRISEPPTTSAPAKSQLPTRPPLLFRARYLASEIVAIARFINNLADHEDDPRHAPLLDLIAPFLDLRPSLGENPAMLPVWTNPNDLRARSVADHDLLGATDDNSRSRAGVEPPTAEELLTAQQIAVEELLGSSGAPSGKMRLVEELEAALEILSEEIGAVLWRDACDFMLSFLEEYRGSWGGSRGASLPPGLEALGGKRGKRILELGAGCGYVGLALAADGAEVCLTDMAVCLVELAVNRYLNIRDAVLEKAGLKIVGLGGGSSGSARERGREVVLLEAGGSSSSGAGGGGGGAAEEDHAVGERGRCTKGVQAGVKGRGGLRGMKKAAARETRHDAPSREGAESACVDGNVRVALCDWLSEAPPSGVFDYAICCEVLYAGRDVWPGLRKIFEKLLFGGSCREILLAVNLRVGRRDIDDFFALLSSSCQDRSPLANEEDIGRTKKTRRDEDIGSTTSSGRGHILNKPINMRGLDRFEIVKLHDNFARGSAPGGDGAEGGGNSTSDGSVLRSRFREHRRTLRRERCELGADDSEVSDAEEQEVRVLSRAGRRKLERRSKDGETRRRGAAPSRGGPEGRVSGGSGISHEAVGENETGGGSLTDFGIEIYSIRAICSSLQDGAAGDGGA